MPPTPTPVLRWQRFVSGLLIASCLGLGVFPSAAQTPPDDPFAGPNDPETPISPGFPDSPEIPEIPDIPESSSSPDITLPRFNIDAPAPDLQPQITPLVSPLAVPGQPLILGYPIAANPAIEPVAILRLPFPELPFLLFPPGSPQLLSGSLPPTFPNGLFKSSSLLFLDLSLIQDIVDLPGGSDYAAYIYLNPSQQPEATPTSPPSGAIAAGDSPRETLELTSSMEDCYAYTQTLGQGSTGLADQLIQCYSQNLEVAQEYGNQAWTAYALNNLAVAHFLRADYQQALAYHQQLLALAQVQESDLEIGVALSGVGAAHAALGQYDQAIDYYQQALDYLPSDQAPQWRSLTLRNLGNALLSQRQIDAAIDYQQQSLALAQAIGDVYGEAQARGNLGNAYALLGRFDEAVAMQQQSWTFARQLQDPLLEAQALLGLGTAYGYQQAHEEALDYYTQALNLTRLLQARLGEGIALTNLGDTLFRLDRLTESQGKLYEAIALWESLRAGLGTNDTFKVSIFETQAATYSNLQEVLVAQGKVEAALEVAERGRARAFVELLARRSGSQVSTPAPPSIAAMERLAQQQGLTLVEYSIIRDQFVEVPHGASVQFPSDPQETALYAWVVQPSGQVAFRQVDWPTDMPAVDQMVQQGRQAMGLRGRGIEVVYGGDRAPVGPEMAQLQTWYQLLIAPIEEWLPSEATDPVVFVPQEALFLVPFPALQDANGDYLVEHHTPMTAPSIQLLGLTLQRADQRSASAGPGDWLIVGNPQMPTIPEGQRSSQPLPSLPGAEAEAEAIASLVNTPALIGATATESRVTQRLPQARYIHLATHGLLDDVDNQGIPGAIALTPDASTDGFLTASELFHLDLQADLVVLSACDTGGGRITGDGVIGLSRSFLSSGADSVVVSLWMVPDEATADLMTAFYQALPQTPDKAQALRQAMLSTRQRYPHPTAWAGFTLTGDWR